jgi:hypothetical protein
MALVAQCGSVIISLSFCMSCERGLVFLLKNYFRFLLFVLVSHLYSHIAATSGFRLNQKIIRAASTSSGTMGVILHVGEYSVEKNIQFLGRKHKLNRPFILSGCRNLLIIALEIRRINMLFGLYPYRKPTIASK